MSTNVWVKSVILLFIGIFCSTLGVILKRVAQRKEKYDKTADGSILELVLDEADLKGKVRGIKEYYYPVIVYYANGQLTKVRAKEGKFPTTYRINDKVTVRYDGDNPKDCVVQERNLLKSVHIWQICYVLGIVFCLISILNLFVNQ